MPREAPAGGIAAAWSTCVGAVLADGHEYTALPSNSIGSGRVSRELRAYQFSVANPRRRILHHTVFSWPVAVARFVWMMSGSNALAPIAFYAPGVRRLSADGETLAGSDIGRRIFVAAGNQLSRVRELLLRDPTTRRAAISIYNALDCGPDELDVPCVFGLLFHVRDRKLQATALLRSNNAFRLLPYDFFELSMLAEVLAVSCGFELDSMNYFAGSMHVYERDFSAAAALTTVSDFDMPPMPAGDVFDQVQRLVEFESQIREAATDGGERLARVHLSARESLEPYWFALFTALYDYAKEHCTTSVAAG